MQPTASSGKINNAAATTEGTKAPKSAGQWMYLNEAAELTQLSEKTLRRHIKRGLLKAKKGKTVNAKIQVLLDSDTLAKISTALPVEEVDEDFTIDGVELDEQSTDSEDATATDFSPNPSPELKPDMDMFKNIINEMMSPLLKRVEEQAILLQKQEREIENHKVELRLLPDIQTREKLEREARELAELEKIALQKQIKAMEAEKEELAAQAAKTVELEKQLALAKRTWWQKIFAYPEPN